MILNIGKFNGLHRLRTRYNLLYHHSTSSSSSSSSSSIPSPSSTETSGTKTINAWDNWEYGTFNTKLVKANTEQDKAIKDFINSNTNTVHTGQLYTLFQRMNESDLDKGITKLLI